MLGSDVLAALVASGHEVESADLPDFDLSDPASVTGRLLEEQPAFDACVNCAAYTAVDAAETHVEEATAINTLGPGYLARACAAAGTQLVHISTDFVFDGHKSFPYTEEDTPNPLQVYGRTKLEGEEAVLAGNPNSIILRTSWLYGPSGKSFPRTMLEAARAGKPLKVVRDQIGTPTYTAELARVIVAALERKIWPGLYHAAGADVLSWFEFARRVLDAADDTRGYLVEPILSWEWPTPAVRPRYSALAADKLNQAGIAPIQPLAASLKDFLARLS